MFMRLPGLFCFCLFLLSACSSPSTAPSTSERSVHQDPQRKVCTERPPESYTSSVENRLKAELPLLGKSEAQAEGTVKSYLQQKSGGTKRSADLATYLFYICQMANNGGWSEDRTERLITLVSTWPVEEREPAAPNPNCMHQLQSGYALKEKIDEEYSRNRKAGTFQSHETDFVKKWATDEREWEIITEAMLVDMGGALNRERFRHAPISSSRPQGNWQWSTITTQLQGKILALEGICKGTVTN